jgi:hypothetical protein
MGLTLDYLIPMFSALISLGPYMARALIARAQEKDLGKVGTKERTNVGENHAMTGGAMKIAQIEMLVRGRGIVMARPPQKVGPYPPICGLTCGPLRCLLQKHCETELSELTPYIK